MKLYDLSLVVLLIFFAASVIFVGVSYECLGPDSEITKDAEEIVEVEAEALIKKETGIEIPLPIPKVTNATNQK